MKKLVLMLAVLILPFTAIEAVKIHWSVGGPGWRVGSHKGYGYYGHPYHRWGYRRWGWYGPRYRWGYRGWGYPYYRHRYWGGSPRYRWYCDPSGYCYYRGWGGGYSW